MHKTHNRHHCFAALAVSAMLALTACGGGDGDAGTGDGAIAPNNPSGSASITLSGAVGALAANNGAQPIGTVTATVTQSGNNISSSTNVVVQLGAGDGALSVVFDTTTGAIANATLQLGTPSQTSFLSASCGPCTGASVNVSARTITLANTPLDNSANPPVVLVNVSGTVRY